MPHHPNLTVQLTDQDLTAIRKLAAALDLVSVGGIRSGEGSPRRLLQALAHATQKHGVKRTAEAIRALLPAEEK